jgi:hypothetical protein
MHLNISIGRFHFYKIKLYKIIIKIQEIFVNPSPFRSRQKVTDVKSDGLPKQKKIYSIK